MSLTVCIPDLIEQGKLTGQRAVRAKALYDGLLNKYDHELGDAAAKAAATADTVKALEREFAYKKRVVAQTVKAQSDWLKGMRDLVGGDEKPLDAGAAREWLERLDKRADAVRNSYLAGFSQMMEKHRRNLLGEVRHRDDLTLAVREMFGENTGDLNAKELAQGMDATNEALRVRRNAAGGQTAKLDGPYIPQRHDSRLIRTLAPDQAEAYRLWRALPSIDNARIRDVELQNWATGSRREDILRGVFDSIWTDGANKSKPGTSFGGSMANQRADARVIHFANADDWLSYAQRFGGTDNIYDVFVGHVSAMSREIALMEAMGPNPSAMLRFQKDWIEKSTRQFGTQKDIDGTRIKPGVGGKVNKLQATFDELTAANKVPDSRALALTFSGVRSVQVAAKLGSAILSSVNDFATLISAAHYNRIPVMQALGRYMKLWTPGVARGDREMAVRLGLVTDDWLALSSASFRYTGEEMTGEISRRMADFVIRSQGLARHTRNGQWAFGMEFFGHLTAMRDRDFGNLDPAIQRAMTTHGVSIGDWDMWRATAPVEERGSSWILPEHVADRGAAERMLQMVLTETDYAVITPDIRTRTQMNSMLRPGSLLGEIGRSMFLFKSFPLAMINLHGRRMLDQPGWSKALYAAQLGGLLIAGGALSAQLKLLWAEKDPQPMNDRKFLVKAIVQSGGLGIFGDLLYNSTNSFGGGLAQTVGGPLVQTGANVGQLLLGNAVRAFDGDDETETRFGRDIMTLARTEVPGSNLWYTRFAWQRLFLDNVQRLIDPAADEYYERQAKRAEKEGTAFWMAPGEGLPDRGPDWGNVFAETE